MDEFLKMIKKQKILLNVTLLSLIVCMISMGIILVFLINKKYVYLIFPAGVFLLFSLIICLIRKAINHLLTKYHKFELDEQITYDYLKNEIEKKDVISYSNNDNCIVYQLVKRKSKYRILLYKTDDYTNKKYSSARKSANKGFNKKYNVKSEDSIREIASRRRINMVFVDEINDKLDDYLSIPADQYVNMASSLLNVAITKNTLYIPCYIGWDFLSVFEYENLVKMVFELIDKEKIKGKYESLQ